MKTRWISFVSTHSKIIYLIEDDTIYVVDFWDIRMKPWTLISRVLSRIDK